ncbi:hypothetical protein RJT34_08789 [Clitoria ternatea]|uniref:Uncharacterized protein n=1 Tax=Clitoria ternatea TaxID=43366 RepID=A0AAN9PVZ5_CLITE
MLFLSLLLRSNQTDCKNNNIQNEFHDLFFTFIPFHNSVHFRCIIFKLLLHSNCHRQFLILNSILLRGSSSSLSL